MKSRVTRLTNYLIVLVSKLKLIIIQFSTIIGGVALIFVMCVIIMIRHYIVFSLWLPKQPLISTYQSYCVASRGVDFLNSKV